MPAKRIIENNYNMTLAGLGLIEPEKVNHLSPVEILESIDAKEKKVFAVISNMRDLLAGGNGNGA